MKILLAEDEVQLSRVYTAALSHQGYEVVPVYNGQEAVNKVRGEVFDVMIFDIMMPVKTGLEAVSELRAQGDKTPIIMLTAMGEIEDKVIGLENGADDYLAKPISLKELLARLASLERRLRQFTSKELTSGNVALNLHEQALYADNSIRLSSKECQLMEFFMRNQGKYISTREIFQRVWAKDESPDVDEGYVYIYVSYLRQKLKSIQATLIIEGEENGSYKLLVVEDMHVS